jgi:AcrR family transcriptional regulator
MATTPTVDGRTARAKRTREAVVDALLALINEGDLRPTAPRIADRAGVSLRSVFQHFSDLEGLYAVAAGRQLVTIAGMVRRLPATGPLEGRLDAFVVQRTRVLEALTAVQRASALQEPFSPQLQATTAQLVRLARAEVAHVFRTELEAHPAADRRELLDALDGASQWWWWEQLRTRQGLSVKRAQRVVVRTMRALLDG